MGRRQEYRQHSKSTLLRATETLFREREVLILVEGRKWRRRLAWAVAGALLVGVVLGALVQPWLRPLL